MKKKVLIIFPDEWLSHSPTILNLVRSLDNDVCVKVIAFDDGTFDNESLEGPSYSFIRVNRTLARFFLRKVRFVYGLLKTILLLRIVRSYRCLNESAHIIGVDSIGLWVAQRVFGRAHFLSLETKKDFFFRRCKQRDILSLVIQSTERAHFLFQNNPPRTFLIQNSPIIHGNTQQTVSKRSFNFRLVFLGNILPEHGIFRCLDAIERMADEGFTLTIKGILYRNEVRNRIFKHYGDLISKGTVTLDENYVAQDGIIGFLSQFSIGFCFYDFNIISKEDFNYISSPSGKVFNYFAAGVPVIGTDILGLRSVKDFGTGVLLQEPSVQKISQAVLEISKRFSYYHSNCLKAAQHFDFARAVEPYRDFLFPK